MNDVEKIEFNIINNDDVINLDTKNNKTNLLQCPFCGSEAFSEWWVSPYAVRYPQKNTKIYHKYEMFKVYANCGCKVCNITQFCNNEYEYANHESLRKKDLDIAYKEAGEKAMIKAVEKWNARIN